MVEFDLNLNLKIFNLLNYKFKPISNFQMKSSFSNITLSKSMKWDEIKYD